MGQISPNRMPLVMIPGMMCDGRLFAPQVAAFSGTRTVHLAPINTHDTVQALANQILINAPDQFALAGLSMGGIVAMEVLRQAPDRVERLALMDTNPRAELDAVKALRIPQMEAVVAGGLAEIMSTQMIPNYAHTGTETPDIDALCLAMALNLGPDVFLRQSRALRDRPDQCATLRAFDRPALVLCGESDKPCPLERHQLMVSLIPGATLQVIEKAGHLTTLEQPNATNAALTRWLEE